jgi:hypothetical protein
MPGCVYPPYHRCHWPASVRLLGGQAHGEPRAQHGSVMWKCIKRPALERAYALGFLCQAVFSYPHATKAKRSARKGHRVSFDLRQASRTVKQGAGLGKLSTGEDRLGPLDH